MITLKELADCARGLESNEWNVFAERVSEIDPVVGELVHLHAQVADHISPPVMYWPADTLGEAQELYAAGIETVEGAREWWHTRYDIDAE